MANLILRGKYWWARFYLPNGQRVAKSTGSTSKREAGRIAGEMEAKARRAYSEEAACGLAILRILERAGQDASAGRLTVERAEMHLLDIRQAADPRFRRRTVADQVALWLEAREMRVTESTACTYGRMRRLMAETFPEKVWNGPVADLTPEDIEKAVARLAAGEVGNTSRKRRAATVNQFLRTFRQAIQGAVIDGHARMNPAAGIRPLPEVDSIVRAPFSPEEVGALLDATQGREWHGLILLAARTGLRMADCLATTSAQISEGCLFAVPAKTRRKRQARVKIPLAVDLAAWLHRQPGPEYFPELSQLTKGEVSRQFAQLCDRAGVPRRITLPCGTVALRSFHCLRHTFVHHLADAGIPADVRRSLAAHSDEKIHHLYTHHDVELAKAIAALPDFTAGPQDFPADAEPLPVPLRAGPRPA